MADDTHDIAQMRERLVAEREKTMSVIAQKANQKPSLHKFYFDAISRARRTGERYGQAMFNHLCQVDSGLAEAVRATDKDPFHCKSPTDANFDRFIAFIEFHWRGFNGSV